MCNCCLSSMGFESDYLRAMVVALYKLRGLCKILIVTERKNTECYNLASKV